MTRNFFPALVTAAALGAAALAPLRASAGGDFWIAFARTAPAAQVTGSQSEAPRFATTSTGSSRDREATRPSISEITPTTSK